MNAGIEPGGANALVDRAKAIILKPAEEWPKIEVETRSQRDILTGYVLPLAAIGPVASLIGGQVFGYGALGFSFRPSLTGSVVSAIVSYILSIAAVYLLMFIADALAPQFGGQANRDRTFRLVAYSYTAGWLAGIFGLIPSLGFFGLLGLYSIYLIYTGAPVLLKVPQEKAAGFTAVTILAAVVLMMIITPITAAVTGLFGLGAVATLADSEGEGTVTLPGGRQVDLGKVEELGKQMENAGKAPAVEATKMQELLPAAIGAYQRTATETMAVGAMGSTAVGTYTAGEKSFKLSIADMSALGALAGMGTALGIEESHEDANSYDRTASVNGRMQTEAWDKAAGSGKFGQVIANRFMVSAEGSAGSIDELKAAVAEIDPDDLAELVD